MKLQWRESARDSMARDFVISRASARDVTGAVWRPESPTPETPLLLLGHGASGDRYQTPNPYLARRGRDAGWAILALDGPVHGQRQVGEGGRTAFAQEMRRPAFLDEMVEDWEVALGTLRAEAEIGAGRLAYFGLSMGSIFGVPLLAARTDVCAAGLGLLGTTGAMAHIASRLRDDAAKIHVPLVFFMQLEDELFPREGVLELFDHLGSPRKTLHANPGRHSALPAHEVDFAFDFVSRHLAGSPARESEGPVAS